MRRQSIPVCIGKRLSRAVNFFSPDRSKREEGNFNDSVTIGA